MERPVTEVRITEMPSQDVLERFLELKFGVRGGVYFDIESGTFIDLNPDAERPARHINISEMPEIETLEQFLRKKFGEKNGVHFDLTIGRFVDPTQKIASNDQANTVFAGETSL